ncbi:hypothetical protein BWQ96_03917 [Gracilariopsis chorda]|uniref:Kinetochore protein SPC25 n=1 Tax=Gracilariopsis chorda TaxID=448386 RepID=A0A2V3IVW6_9FLOR|nr:hypothetical protein BWQ96_03917 [Gracilariopsis chorda]|eukprot:PXF46261.1 hypothetical protein BWQ96_03917 [Gracilariopsis chorda]
MRDGNQNESSGPSLVAQSHHPLKNEAWAANLAKFEQLQKDYDEEYNNATKELCEIADLVPEIRTKRTDDVCALREQHQEWVEAVKQVQRTANDTAVLDMRGKEIEELESQKRELLEEFIRGNEENKDLEKKFNDLDLPKLQLRKVDQAVRRKEQHEVPTLEFTLRVLKTMSRSFLSHNTDGNVIEGFTIQEEENDMRPFRFDNETPLFERVNYVWEQILHGIDSESPREMN